MQEQILDALRRGDTAAALDAARAFADDAPNDAQAQRLLAQALRAGGDAGGAQAAIERAIALAPEDASLHLEHAGLLFGMRDVEGATRALDATVGLDPNRFAAYIMQAQLALGRNDLDEAARLLRLAERVEPAHPRLQAVQGTLALRRGNADEALKLVGAASQRAPTDPVVLHALGFAYFAQGHLAFAEEAFRKLLEVAPGARMLRLLIAQAQLRQGRPGDAADELATLLEDPTAARPELRRHAAELELAAGRPERALPLLRDLLAAQPGEPRTLAAIVETWRRLGDAEDARRTLDAALATSPAHAGLWRARLAFEPSVTAADLVARWRAQVPDAIEPLEEAMLLHARQGRPAESEAVARELLERMPGHAHAEMSVIDALLARDPRAAVERLEDLIPRSAGPDNRRVLEGWLGLARHRAGDFKGALAAWSARHAEQAPSRLPLPTATAAPGEWVDAAAVAPDTPPAAFLVGLPGSHVERAAQLLTVVPTFREDRFGMQPPQDGFQDVTAWPRIADGRIEPGVVAASWRAALPARRIGGAVIDWLPWWDNAYATVLRAALPEALLLVALRDPRDMLLEWLAFDGPTPFALASPDAAAQWLADALEQLAGLHEADVVPHRVLRMDETGASPAALAAQLSEALDIALPEPPARLFRAPGFTAGAWRDYAGLLAGPFATLAPVARRLGYPDA